MRFSKEGFVALFLIFLTGYLGLALELMVLRQVANFVGSTAAVSSIVIGIYLAAMTGGYFAGTKKPRREIGGIAGVNFLIIAALILLAASYPLISAYFGAMAAAGISSHIIQTFVYSLVFVSAAPFLLGFNTAVLSQNIHEKERDNTGIIMGVGTIGSVLGSLLTTLLFMSVFGVNHTIMLTLVLAGIGAYVALQRIWVLLAAAGIFAGAYFINNSEFLHDKYGIVSNNAENTVAVYEDLNNRYLFVDSAVHSIVSMDGKYHAKYINFINDRFIDTIPANETKNILVLGAGGFTAGHSDMRNKYTFVDIDRALPEIAERYFLKEELPANKRFVVQDASQFLKMTDEKYDLIIMDIFSRWTIPESAITTDFMRRMKSALAPGGIIIMNTITSAAFGDNFSQKLDNTIRSVFPSNLSRHMATEFNGWDPADEANVLYIYFDAPNDGGIYTPDKNSTIYDRKSKL
jgi:predicted membrane-bound spermidine synthase